MPAATHKDEYRPVYVIKIYLESGTIMVATRDVELRRRLGMGAGQGGAGLGAAGGGGEED